MDGVRRRTPEDHSKEGSCRQSSDCEGSCADCIMFTLAFYIERKFAFRRRKQSTGQYSPSQSRFKYKSISEQISDCNAISFRTNLSSIIEKEKNTPKVVIRITYSQEIKLHTYEDDLIFKLGLYFSPTPFRNLPKSSHKILIFQFFQRFM